jgi:hypothetical protein
MLFAGSTEIYVNVVGMHLKTLIFASVLVLVGLALFFYGTSMSKYVMKPDSLISGTYLVVLGIFLAIAGFMVLVSQIFRGHLIAF